MKSSAVKRFLAFLLALAMPVGSYAAVITFDEPYAPFFGIGVSTTTQGFFFQFGEDNSAGIHGKNPVQSCFPECPYNGTNYLHNLDSGLFTAVTMTRSDGRQFHLRQFDAGESNMGLNFEAAQIDVIGTRMGGSTVSASFVLDHINDGSGPLVDFQTFLLPHSFSGLVSVTFNGSGGFYDGPEFIVNDFSLDNISIFAVPEPTTLALLAIGSFVFGFARYKQ